MGDTLLGLDEEEHTKALLSGSMSLLTRYVENGTDARVLVWLGHRLTHLLGTVQRRAREIQIQSSEGRVIRVQRTATLTRGIKKS